MHGKDDRWIFGTHLWESEIENRARRFSWRLIGAVLGVLAVIYGLMWWGFR